MKKQLMAVAATAGLLLTTFGGAVSAHENTYNVESGDTLYKIARENQITISDLQTWNKLSGNTIYVNQKLTLIGPHSHDSNTIASTSYMVKSGDTLWGIATRHSLSVSQLKSINNLSSDTIHVGQVLKIAGTATTPPVSTVSKVDALIVEAKKYIGTPYVWGGNTTLGFDCSGYLRFVFNSIGVSIPRTVATIWNATQPVSTLKTGDLVFFETYATGPSHAGIYLGNNKFIHAGSSTGVTISDMSISYWNSRYLGAKSAL